MDGFEIGALWRRWDPHIHTPGTVLNDQFKTGGDLDAYLTAIEQCTPKIEALGVTDYYSLDCYEKVLSEKNNGRISNCQLLFPNVELRLDIGTVKSAWVNMHLLISPEDDDHVAEAKRFLERLTFEAHGDSFSCKPKELVRLGKQADDNIRDDGAALKKGTEQFKVSLRQLREQFRGSDWAQANILIGVAGNSVDGASAVREGADATLREEIEKLAHIVFSSSPRQRDFWIGLSAAASPEAIIARYGGLKPCLHGSDAHDFAHIGVPDQNRYCWLKGAPAFDTLRQAYIDPAARAFVGDEPPIAALPSQVITALELRGADWLKTPRIELNPGLVAVIGARGSGKTALADILAIGCDVPLSSENDKSFVSRAGELLRGNDVAISWHEGSQEVRSLTEGRLDVFDTYPRARYLSQQFVDELCSAEGMTDGLLEEIERVIFDSHDLSSREGAIGFQDLRDSRAARHRQARERDELTISALSDRISGELEKTQLLGGLRSQIAVKSRLIGQVTADRSKLVTKPGSEHRLARLEALTSAAEKVRGYVRYFNNQQQDLLLIQDEVSDLRANKAPEALRSAKEKHKDSGLKDDEWKPFTLDYKGDVEAVISKSLTDANKHIKDWKGEQHTVSDSDNPFIADDAELDRQPLSLLEAETERLQKLISVDRGTADRFRALSRKLVEENDALDRLKEKLSDYEGANARASELYSEREAAYVRVFEAVLAEQKVLVDLYSPIRSKLGSAGGTLSKLSFQVKRTADVVRWANEGEQLLDLRKQGPFRGQGTLREFATATLKKPWEQGTAEDVVSAMKKFREDHQADLLEHAPVPKTDLSEYRDWTKKFARWLFSTEHIHVRYGVFYDEVDIQNLSPGTRGIVLLLLYLTLDDADDRPLIIDQPEENLDPKSIYDELVPLFRAAKARRQVIMVTHNANLVVNADADQVIVAEAGPHEAGSLPPITYLSGGLETFAIRTAVCDILEGGEIAFKERARRLRVKLER